MRSDAGKDGGELGLRFAWCTTDDDLPLELFGVILDRETGERYNVPSLPYADNVEGRRFKSPLLKEIYCYKRRQKEDPLDIGLSERAERWLANMVKSNKLRAFLKTLTMRLRSREDIGLVLRPIVSSTRGVRHRQERKHIQDRQKSCCAQQSEKGLGR